MGTELSAPPHVLQSRRQRLAAVLDQPLVVFAGHAPARNYASNEHRFRAASNYLYLGGFPLQNAALVIHPGSDGSAGCALFRPPPGADDPLWLGEQPSDDDIAQAMGISDDDIRNLDALEAAVAGADSEAIVPPFPNTIDHARRLGCRRPDDRILSALIDMRLIKDEYEIAALRDAARVGADAHRAAMGACRVGANERDVQAALVAALEASGCTPSFTPIVTVRGEVLHGACAGRQLTDGALMLVDAGAQLESGYASDITRTFPVSGSWTTVQRSLYDTVLGAQRCAIDACTPGTRYRDIHMIAAREISRGLADVGLLKGDPDELTQRGAYALFFAHGVGHLLGLDVHDMEDFGDLAGYAPDRTRPQRFGDKFLRLDRDLTPGMVVTIEPGIYLVPAIWRRDDLVGPHRDVVNLPFVKQLIAEHFGGIRIEEDVLVRPSEDGGPEILNSTLPNDADAVTALVGM